MPVANSEPNDDDENVPVTSLINNVEVDHNLVDWLSQLKVDESTMNEVSGWWRIITGWAG